jgi:hypothetical protein
MTIASAQPRSDRKNRRGRLDTDASGEDYKVGPGRPPKEHQFQPGQSGNPKGAKRKAPSIAPDLKALLERALNRKVTLRQGEKEQIVSKAAAGIEQLVNQFAKGDRHARRDLIVLADKLDVDLTAGRAKAIEKALVEASTNDEALLADYVRRHASEDGHRGDDIDAGPPHPKESDKPGVTNPGEKRT